MNRTETLAVMSILKAAYPAYYRDMKRQDAEAVVNLWSEMLADYPAMESRETQTGHVRDAEGR